MANTPRVRLSWPYLGAFLGLLALELAIARYVHDGFVRPFVGDALVVVLLYTCIRACCDAPVVHSALCVWLFAFGVEFAQYFRLVDVLGVRHIAWLRVAIGTHYDPFDLLAYTAGTLGTVFVEGCRRDSRVAAGSVVHCVRAAEGRGEHGVERMVQDWRTRAVSPAEVIAHVRSGNRVFVHGASATPTPLLDALAARKDLEQVQLYHLHLNGSNVFADPRHGQGIFSNSLFTGANQRAPIERGEAEFIPVFLSDIPALFTSQRIPLDVALLQVSPPDRHGHCTLGTSVDTAKAAAESATIILAEINERMPRTHGNTIVPLSRITAFVHSDRPLYEAIPEPAGPVEERIGELISELVEHGSTLQMGVGAIPNAVLGRLGDKHDLGVHTEMFTDGLIPLIEGGVVTNRYKEVHRRRTVTSFVAGSTRVFDYVHDNQLVEFHPCDRTNDTALIRMNPKVCAINAALEIDLTGQVCADSIGSRIFSGIGGQMDFIRGAAMSVGGKAIIAMPSTAAGGKVSRIATTLKNGAGVVTTRGHVHYVVTEYGVVDLHGKNLRQRAEALISIAHPDFRSELRQQVNALRHFVL